MTRTWLVLIYLFLIITTNMQAMSHFADNGCDGGTCTVLLIFFSVPFTISWLLSLIGVLFMQNQKSWKLVTGIILCVISMFIAAMLLTFGEESNMSEIKKPVYVFLIVNEISISFFLLIYLRKHYIAWKNL